MNIVDIILVALVVIIIVMSAKKGFVASCLDALSLAVASIGSYLFCTPITEWLYKSFVGELMKTEFRQALDDMSKSLSVSQKVQGMLEALPETAIKLLEGRGGSIDSISKTVTGLFSDEEILIQTVADGVGRDIMIYFLEIVVFIILFVLFTVIIRLLVNFFSHNLEKIPVVGTLDTVLGGALGLIKGLLIVVAGSVLLYIILSTAEQGSPLEMISTSKIYMFMLEYNPVIQLIRGN